MDEDRNRAGARDIGRVMSCMRSFAALVVGRSRQSASEVRRRFSTKIHLVLGLFFCRSLAAWERSYRPYKPICTQAHSCSRPSAPPAEGERLPAHRPHSPAHPEAQPIRTANRPLHLPQSHQSAGSIAAPTYKPGTSEQP